MKIQLYTADWQPVTELVDATTRSANVIRANEAARFSFGIPHDSVDTTALKMASHILVEGRIPARITHRDASGPVVELQAIGCEDLLNHLITPRRWTYWNEGTEGYLDGDLATIVKDMLKRAQQRRWTTLADFNNAHQLQDVEVINLPDMGDSVILNTRPYKNAEQYLSTGHITIRTELPGTALPSGKLVRWTEHVGDTERIRVRTRTAASEAALSGASWGQWMTAVHAEEIEDNETIGVPAMDGGPWIDIQLELKTEDQTTADDEDEPTIYGTTPVLAGVELIWRESSPISAGDIPAETGVIITDTEYNRLTHLRALVELCDLHGYTFRVRLQEQKLVLDLSESFGLDRSDKAIFRDGDNAGIEVLRDADDELANVLHCWGAGSGADQLYVELRDEESIGLYGERHADWEQSDITDMGELQTKGQEELEKRSAIKTEYQVITTIEQLGDAWLQDSVTVIDPRSGDLRILPVEEIRVEDDAESGEIVRLGLDTELKDIVDAIVEGRTKPSGIKPPRTLPTPTLRAEGRFEAIRLMWTQITGATGYDIEHMVEGEWHPLATSVPGGSYDHPGLELGSRHAYRIFAKRGDQRSPASNTATAYAMSRALPDTPTQVQAAPGPGKVVRISWDAPNEPDVTTHYVYRKPGNDPLDPANATLLGQVAGTAYLDTTGNYGAGYTWFVRAANRDGNLSGYSTGAFAVVPDDVLPDGIPDTPQGLRADFSGTDLELTWKPAVGAATYLVQILEGDETLRRQVEVGGAAYRYVLGDNRADGDGNAGPNLVVRVWAKSARGVLSADCDEVNAVNDAPINPSINVTSSQSQIRWAITSPLPADWVETTVTVGSFSTTGRFANGVIDLQAAGIADGTTAQVTVVVRDAFGQTGTKSANTTGIYLTRQDMQGGLFEIQASVTNLSGVPIPLTLGCFENLWDGYLTSGAYWDGAARITFRYPMMWLFDMVRLWTGNAVAYYVEVEVDGQWARATPDEGTLTTKAGAWTVQRFRRMFATQAVRITFPDASSPDLRELKFWTVTLADEILAQRMQLTDSMWIESEDGRTRITGHGLVTDDGEADRIHTGDISGRPWGSGALPEGTYGTWGDNAGLYLRGYANTIVVAYAQDEELIDLRDYDPANPQIMVAPKSMLTYSPQQKDAVPIIFTDAVQEESGLYRIKAKTLIRGAYSSWPVGWTEGNDRKGAWQQPQLAAPNGKKGVDTNFIRCRVHWYASATYVIGVYQYVTSQFDANGQPVNWQQKRSFTHQGPLFGSHSGTLDWDLSLPQGQWAIRVSWDGGNPPAATYASAEVTSAGYRSNVYLDMGGSAIAPDAPSGMDVMYYAFDRG
jgi:hypothetical protein